MRKFFKISRWTARPDPREQIARGMILRVADDRDAAAVGEHRLALGHGLGRVVGAFAVHVGLQQAQQPVHVGIGKQHDVVDALERRHHLGAIGRAQNRAAGTLQPTHRPIVVDRDDEPIGLRLRIGEIAHVPDVQDIETAVRKRDGAAFGAFSVNRRRRDRVRSESFPRELYSFFAIRYSLRDHSESPRAARQATPWPFRASSRRDRPRSSRAAPLRRTTRPPQSRASSSR